ncbi:flagellar biosynthesis protein FlhF [Listeria welshimeri]|nr:flagellar biosynthesis protein FlhF [Listeria welshimeri]
MGKHLVEKMEIFKANSKREIHKKIRLVTNEPYKITDERVTKLGVFKKQYEVTAVIMSEVAIADGRIDFQETFQKSVVKSRPKTDDLLKKEKLLEMLASGAELVASTPLLEERKTQEEELANMHLELAALNRELAVKMREEREQNSDFVKFLKGRGISDTYVADFMQAGRKQFKQVETAHLDDIRDWFVPYLSGKLAVEDSFDLSNHRIISLIGQTGVGKTTTLVKLGWQLLKQNRTVGFITTDTFRSGAVEQFQGYADKLDVELIVATSPAELEEAVQYMTYVSGVDHILIDTVGRNYLAEESVNEIAAYTDVVHPDLTCFTFSSGMKSADVMTILPKLAEIPIDGFIITKMDETTRIGDLYTVMQETNLPVLYMTDGQNITENIFRPKSRWLAERFVGTDRRQVLE